MTAHDTAMDVPGPSLRAADPHPVSGRASLPDLAEHFGTDSAPSRERTSELYQMLFHGLRDRPVKMLILTQTDPPTALGELAVARLWLQYFAKGCVHVLDACDLSGLADDRFVAHRANPEDGAGLRAALAGAGGFDIILDDASHASHHQQTAFLSLFPLLASGGMYIIESLRSQPAALERDGITRTAALFRGFLQHRRFQHSDPATQAAFAACADEISGCLLSQVNFDKNRRDQVAIIQKR